MRKDLINNCIKILHITKQPSLRTLAQNMDQKKPEIAVVVSSSKTQMNVSGEAENKTRADQHGGCSSNFTQGYKAEEFADKHTGALFGHKEDDDDFIDLEQGYGTEHKTQVKSKESV